jgi:hypothetical protein
VVGKPESPWLGEASSDHGRGEAPATSSVDQTKLDDQVEPGERPN